MTPPFEVPFNQPSAVGRELEYIAEAVQGNRLAGDGPFTHLCQEWLEKSCRAHRVLLTHSCTAALELAALLCEVGDGDEVIMPSFTFVSTANAFVLRGARPVFVDIRPDTLNLDERLIEGAVTEKTRAIVPVHYAGVACEMEAILHLADRFGLRVVEDAAQGLGATYDGRPLGALGDLGCWSFHETKNITCGEGGALAVRDKGLAERAEILREKGTNRSKFFRGEVEKYTWVDVGSSYLASELVAAYLAAQLEKATEILARRRGIVDRYHSELADLEADGLLRLPVVPPRCAPNGHMLYLLLPSETVRNALLSHLRAEGIGAVFHYVPLHEAPMGQRFGYARGDLPVTESASRRLLRLPCYFGLSESQQERVITAIRRFFSQQSDSMLLDRQGSASLARY